MRVEVTQEDIDRSGAASGNCPIETALIRDFGAASVGRSYAHIVIGDKSTRFKLPPEATLFVINYDHDHKVEPIVFDMEESE